MFRKNELQLKNKCKLICENFFLKDNKLDIRAKRRWVLLCCAIHCFYLSIVSFLSKKQKYRKNIRSTLQSAACFKEIVIRLQYSFWVCRRRRFMMALEAPFKRSLIIIRKLQPHFCIVKKATVALDTNNGTLFPYTWLLRRSSYCWVWLGVQYFLDQFTLQPCH